MTHWGLFLAMFLGGAAAATQPSINARLAEKVGVIESACISFAVGTLALLAVVLLTGRSGFKGIMDAAWWELTGGFPGALIVTLTIVAVPRIGTTATLAAAIAAQLTTGLLLDHFGVFGLQSTGVDFQRLAGVGLLFLGALLTLPR